MREAGSNVLAEHPHFGRSLLPTPAASHCSGAGVSITSLCWTPAPQQLSPAFFCIIRLPEKPRKTPLISLVHMGGREPVGFALLQCRDLPWCLAELGLGTWLTSHSSSFVT